MPKTCVVNGCTNKVGMENVQMFSFPTVKNNEDEATKEMTLKRRRLWVDSINRKLITEEKVKSHHRVCSDHFISGKPADLFLSSDPDWVPSVKMRKEKPVIISQNERKSRVPNPIPKPEMVCQCSSSEEAMSLNDCPALEKILPASFTHIVCCFEQDVNSGSFSALLRLPIENKEVAWQWKTALQEKSKCTFRKSSTFHPGKCNVFKEKYHCQHNVSKRERTTTRVSKKTNCESTLSIIVKRLVKYSRSGDCHLPEFPMIVRIKWRHNHPMDVASILRYRDVGEGAKKRLRELFERGYTPSAAYYQYRTELEAKEGKAFLLAASDREKMPDMAFVYNLRNKMIADRIGKFQGPMSYAEMEEKLLSLCQENKVAVDVSFGDEYFVAAFLTPFMERVHRLVPEAADVVFMDSSGGMDQYKFKVFQLMTQSKVDGLPLGCFLSTSDSTQAISHGLLLLNGLLGGSAFYGRGQQGPRIFMTDNSEAERQAIGLIYPESTQFHCAFHILQAGWRFLWNHTSGVVKEHRAHLFGLLKKLLLSPSTEQLEREWETCQSDTILRQNQKVLGYLMSLMAKRREWFIDLRQDLLLTRGHNMTYIAKVAVRVLKDRALCRCRTHNPIQLADYLTVALTRFYSSRIMDIIRESVSQQPAETRRDTVPPCDISDVSSGEAIPPCNISQVTEDVFNVVITKNDYCVNTLLGLCSCSCGTHGGACKHQFAIQQHYKHVISNAHLLSESDRLKYFEIATGNQKISQDWSKNLENLSDHSQQSETPSDVSDDEDDKEDLNKHLQENLNELLNEFTEISKEIKAKVREHPETLMEPFEKFINNYRKCKTNANLAVALASFANPGGQMSLRSSKKQSHVQAQVFRKSKSRVGAQSPAVVKSRSRKNGQPTTRQRSKNLVNMQAATNQKCKTHTAGRSKAGRKRKSARLDWPSLIPAKKRSKHLCAACPSSSSSGETFPVVEKMLSGPKAELPRDLSVQPKIGGETNDTHESMVGADLSDEATVRNGPGTTAFGEDGSSHITVEGPHEQSAAAAAEDHSFLSAVADAGSRSVLGNAPTHASLSNANASIQSTLGNVLTHPAHGNSSSQSTLGNISSLSSLGNAPSHPSLENVSSHSTLGNIPSHPAVGNVSSHSTLGSAPSHFALRNVSSHSTLGNISSHSALRNVSVHSGINVSLSSFLPSVSVNHSIHPVVNDHPSHSVVEDCSIHSNLIGDRLSHSTIADRPFQHTAGGEGPKTEADHPSHSALRVDRPFHPAIVHRPFHSSAGDHPSNSIMAGDHSFHNTVGEEGPSSTSIGDRSFRPTLEQSFHPLMVGDRTNSSSMGGDGPYQSVVANSFQSTVGDRPGHSEMADHTSLLAMAGDRPSHTSGGEHPSQPSIGDRPYFLSVSDQPNHSTIEGSHPSAMPDRPFNLTVGGDRPFNLTVAGDHPFRLAVGGEQPFLPTTGSDRPSHPSGLF